MASRSKRLRDDYVDGYEIVTLDGGHPVVYVPRSCLDKSPWARVKPVEGVHFRYHAGELKSIGTKATNAYTACQHTADCQHTKATERDADNRRKAYMVASDVDRLPAAETATAAPTGGRYDPSLMAAYDRAEKSLRAAGELDPHWYRM